MIYLTRLNHSSMVLNSDLIQHIEMTPDTVVSLTTGQKFVVLETADEIIERVTDFRRSLLEPRLRVSGSVLPHQHQPRSLGMET